MRSLDPIPLCDLPPGVCARVHSTTVDGAMVSFLRALGLTSRAEFRLCKAGEPCIIQVRSTRIGLSRVVAAQILVAPVGEKAAAS